jgi:hypothetical protein
MGCTHYWSKSDEPEGAYGALVADVRRLVAEATERGVNVEFSEEGTDVFTINCVDEDEYGETFVWERRPVSFECCKTSRYSYDPLVRAVLIAAKVSYGDAVKIKSDDYWHEWDAGKTLYTETLNLTLPDNILEASA